MRYSSSCEVQLPCSEAGNAPSHPFGVREKGIPAPAVLAGDGKLLYSQRNGEFEAARSFRPEDLIGFLNLWKPDSRQK